MEVRFYDKTGGIQLGINEGYKRGQLDYQAGKIEWTVIDGAVHHIEGGKE